MSGYGTKMSPEDVALANRLVQAFCHGQADRHSLWITEDEINDMNVDHDLSIDGTFDMRAVVHAFKGMRVIE